jgi:hypothetical protein
VHPPARSPINAGRELSGNQVAALLLRSEDPSSPRAYGGKGAAVLQDLQIVRPKNSLRYLTPIINPLVMETGLEEY